MIVGALIATEGTCAKILEQAMQKEVKSVTSPAILDELEYVVQRMHLPDKIVELMRKISYVYSPWIQISDCPDLSDNKFLEVAYENGAMIITGDKVLLGMNGYRSLRILTPSAFLKHQDEH